MTITMNKWDPDDEAQKEIYRDTPPYMWTVWTAALREIRELPEVERK